MVTATRSIARAIATSMRRQCWTSTYGSLGFDHGGSFRVMIDVCVVASLAWERVMKTITTDLSRGMRAAESTGV